MGHLLPLHQFCGNETEYRGFAFLIADPQMHPIFNNYVLDHYQEIKELLGSDILITFFARPNYTWIQKNLKTLKPFLQKNFPFEFPKEDDEIIEYAFHDLFEKVPQYRELMRLYAQQLNLQLNKNETGPVLLFTPQLPIGYGKQPVIHRLPLKLPYDIPTIDYESYKCEEWLRHFFEQFASEVNYKYGHASINNESDEIEYLKKIDNIISHFPRGVNSRSFVDELQRLMQNYKNDLRKNEISVLCVKERNNEFKLIDYNETLKLKPMDKAVYLFFWKHRTGVYFKDIFSTENRMLFTNIYRHTYNGYGTGYINAGKNLEPDKVSESLSRIKRTFKKQFKEDIAKLYYISGDKAEERKILLDKSKIIVENGELTSILAEELV